MQILFCRFLEIFQKIFGLGGKTAQLSSQSPSSPWKWAYAGAAPESVPRPTPPGPWQWWPPPEYPPGRPRSSDTPRPNIPPPGKSGPPANGFCAARGAGCRKSTPAPVPVPPPRPAGPRRYPERSSEEAAQDTAGGAGLFVDQGADGAVHIYLTALQRERFQL